MPDARISFVCKRGGELRKKKKYSQHDAFVEANKEWKEKEKGAGDGGK